MARLVITPVQPAGSYPSLQPAATSLDYAYQAPGLASDGIGWLNTGREILLVRNSSAGALTFTVTSVPLYGRSGDITAYSIGANLFSLLGPFDPKGWNQSDGMVYVAGSTTSVLFAVVRLPSNIFLTV